MLRIPIGLSRAGMIFEDLTEFPHLLVAGQTYGGKSNFLHQLILSLLKYLNCKVFIIDMKRLEFELYRNHAWVAFQLQEALKILKYLHHEMHRRLEYLASKEVVKIQDYKGNDLPYLVLVIDEFSQLSPIMAKDEDDKKLRKIAHSYLIDLICMARTCGIHIVIATQRPDRDILPGQLKANIPGTVCFKVRNEINSRICLDNDKAAYLPLIKGRAIYQFHTDREIQVMHVPINRLKYLLPPVRSYGG